MNGSVHLTKGQFCTNEGVRTKEVPFCPLCSNKGQIVFFGLRDKLCNAPGKWNVSQCNSCNSLWVNPQPLKEEIYKFYTTYSTHKKSECQFRENDHNSLVKKIKDLFLLGRCSETSFYEDMFLRGQKPGKLLDVGAGNGTFLALMRQKGWLIEGVEPDPKAVTMAKENYGIIVHEGKLEDLNLPPKTFDAITLSHVIEHTSDPIILLTQCYNLLKPKGKLSITTPNIGSLAYLLFRSEWLHLHIPQHLILYSPRALTQLLRISGFKILFQGTSSRWASGTFNYGIRSKIGKNKENYKSCISGNILRTFLVFIEHWCNIIYGGLGEEIGILAEREE